MRNPCWLLGILTRALSISMGYENSSWLPWGIRFILTTSTGKLKPGRLLLEKWDWESSICWEVTLWGESLLSRGNQEPGLCAILLGNHPSCRGNWGNLIGWKFDFAGEGGLDYSGSAGNWELELWWELWSLTWLGNSVWNVLALPGDLEV